MIYRVQQYVYDSATLPCFIKRQPALLHQRDNKRVLHRVHPYHMTSRIAFPLSVLALPVLYAILTLRSNTYHKILPTPAALPQPGYGKLLSYRLCEAGVPPNATDNGHPLVDSKTFVFSYVYEYDRKNLTQGVELYDRVMKTYATRNTPRFSTGLNCRRRTRTAVSIMKIKHVTTIPDSCWGASFYHTIIPYLVQQYCCMYNSRPLGCLHG